MPDNHNYIPLSALRPPRNERHVGRPLLRLAVAVVAMMALLVAGDAAKPPRPALADGPPPFVVGGIGTGDIHTCASAATPNGVKCWGYNGWGALGDGGNCGGLCSKPTDVTALTTAAAVTAGGAYGCALTDTGGVKCWGSNSQGQLGDGTTTLRWTPVDVCASGSGAGCAGGSLLTGVTAISAGFNFTCAIVGGGVKCWGNNSMGQLGDGQDCGAGFCVNPVDVTGLTANVTAIAAGNQHACALRSGGGVKCWGYNANDGRLGDGTFVNRTTPVDVCASGSGPECDGGSLLTDISAIATGGSHTCALTTAGGVKCWGLNGSGQLGDALACGSTCRNPVNVSGLASGAAGISAGGAHACARLTGNTVKCWGQNYFGQLGNRTTVDSAVPSDVYAAFSTNSLLSGVTSVAAGSQHTCAITNSGAVRCWGRNQWGALGDGTTANRTYPVDVIGLSLLDTDGDALPDYWETTGDLDGDGVMDLNLPAMGADLNVKDVFVEVDWMDCAVAGSTGCETSHSDKPTAQDRALKQAMIAFACAPEPIKLHIDLGQGSIMNPTVFCSKPGLMIGPLWGTTLGQGNAIAHKAELGTSAYPYYSWSEFDTIKSSNFSASRAKVFHYALFVHDIPGWNEGRRLAGLSRGAPGGGFIVSLGSWVFPVPVSNTQRWQAETGVFMHELGHNLGLGHGGQDWVNRKPNYLSIMSYSFGGGLAIGGTLGHYDFSRFDLGDLDENNINESAALEPDSAITTTGGTYGTAWRCENGGGVQVNIPPAPPQHIGAARYTAASNVNFDCDGIEDGITSPLGTCVDDADNANDGARDQNDADCVPPASTAHIESSVSSDVNGDGQRTVLAGYEDWSKLVFSGGAIGDAGPPEPGFPESSMDDISEIDVQQEAAALPDGDADMLLDGSEEAEGTNPMDPDSDDDGVLDGEEVGFLLTDPLDADTDDDGCADGEELEGAPPPKPGATGAYDPLAWYDVYDVPVPAVADPTPNGPRNQVVDIGDVLAALLYAFADEGGPPNANGVAYDSDKMGPGTKAGWAYDRSPSADPNPPWDAGPPNGVIDIGDVLAALAQAFAVDCSGPP